MNYKRKSNLVIIVMVILAVLLTGCAAIAAEFQTVGNQNNGINGDEQDTTLPTATATSSRALNENEIEGSSGMVEDDSVISRYYGSIETVDGLVLYDIATKRLREFQYVIDLQFYDYGSIKPIQQLVYTLRDDFIPETVRDAFQTLNNRNNKYKK